MISGQPKHTSSLNLSHRVQSNVEVLQGAQAGNDHLLSFSDKYHLKVLR